MAVFDPRQGQVLIQPVTEYYRGKAIRQDLKDKEQMAELRGLQIDVAKLELENAPKEWELAKKLAESKQEQIDEALEQGKRDGKWQSMQRSAQVLAPWVQDIGKLAGKQGKNSVAAMQQANATLPQVLEQLSGVVDPDEIEKLSQFAGEDRVLDLNEFMMLGKYLESFMSPQGRRTLSLEESMSLPGMTESRAKNAVVQEDASGEIFIDDAPTGLTAEDVSTRGGLSKAGINQTTVKYRDQVRQAAAGAATATELVNISHDSPAAMAKSGAVITFGNELYVTAKNLVKVVASPALPKSETTKQSKGAEAFDWGDVDAEMERIGVTKEDAARWKSGVYSIAFAAAVGEQGTRPSDVDIQAYIQIYGGQITDPKAFRATIAQAMRRQYNMLKFTADLNPEITDSATSLAVFEGEYNKFLEALDSDSSTETHDDGTTVVWD